MRVIVFIVDLCIAFMIGATIALALNLCHPPSPNQNNPSEKRAAIDRLQSLTSNNSVVSR
jgi:hypothetical protein